ncbi:CHAT domain-containing protein [Streptomyces cyaneofuscatus]|uniref:CHAT domain-containing protein n=1 Tax=Streptomyces cyaneofuscatus TaxID=66883 RepID=UPI0036B6F07D
MTTTDAASAPEFLEEGAARAWLAARGGQSDREAVETWAPVDVLIASRGLSLMEGLDILRQVLSHRQVFRQARTGRHRLGGWHADNAQVLFRMLVVLPPATRLSMAVLAGVAAVLLGSGLPQVALTLGAVLLARWHTTTACLLAVAAAVTDLDTWPVPVLATMTSWYVLSVTDLLWQVMGSAWWARGPVFSFLPLRDRLVLRARRRWTLFTTAVDLATGGQADVAGPFLARCRKVPRRCEPVLDMARAVQALHTGDLSQALLRAGAAAEAARRSPPGVRGWCQAQLSQLLLASGRPDEAAAVRDEALLLLRGRRCRRYARELQIQRLTADLAFEPMASSLRKVHRLRRVALRIGDLNLLRQTEVWLVHLMLRVGNRDGAAWTLTRLFGADDDARTAWHTTPDQAADERILRGWAMVEAGDTRRAARQTAQAALAIVNAGRRPIAAVAARLLLARADELDGRTEAGLAQAVHALAAVHDARYLIPTARGRKQWERAQLNAYATVLRLADRSGDSVLVAEVVETVRGEVLPDRMDRAEVEAHVALDAVTAAAMAPPDSPAEDPAPQAFFGLDPVRRPPPIRVAHRQQLPAGAERSGVLDLDLELSALAGRCWYWSAVTVLDRYYWVVRDPDGQWSHGSADMAEDSAAARADAALRTALPMPLPGEAPDDTTKRVNEGSLSRGAGPDGVKERALLGLVAEAFLPAPLAAGLRVAPLGDVPSLVVSLPAGLAHIPVAALPLEPGTDRRVVEVARVLHVPAWSVISRRRARHRAAPSTTYDLRLAVIAPDGDEEAAARLKSPPLAHRSLKGPVSRERLSKVLGLLDDDRHWLLYLAGHVTPRPNPTDSGLSLAPDGEGKDHTRLSIAEIQAAAGNGSEGDLFPVPERVLAVGCGSLGLLSDAEGDAVRTPTSEWLGFGSALMLAGSDHVVCTLYPVYPVRQLNDIAHRLAERLVGGDGPADALREIQLAELAGWRAAGSGRPFIWQAFVYTGLGV